MKRFLILIPFLLISVKPYQQIQKNEVDIQSDTIMLAKVSDSITIEIERSKELDNKKKALKKELSNLKELNEIKRNLEKFNNRGI